MDEHGSAVLQVLLLEQMWRMPSGQSAVSSKQAQPRRLRAGPAPGQKPPYCGVANLTTYDTELRAFPREEALCTVIAKNYT